jgi:acyl carrier protein
MKRAELQALVASVLEIDPELLEPATDLTSFESFDSVAVLTLMLDLDSYVGIRMSPEQASKLRFYGDIEALALRQGITLVDAYAEAGR